MACSTCFSLQSVDIRVDGHLLHTARLQDEYFVAASDPAALVAELQERRCGADLFTFVQGLHAPDPLYAQQDEFQRHVHPRLSWDQMAVLPLTTYEDWFDKQLRFRPRNRLRKALKSGIETRTVAYTDELVRALMAIYNESPLRQGKANRHYGKSFDTVRREHATFAERSDFVGAYLDDELIGFAKVTHDAQCSIVMNLVAALTHRDKSPTNALLARLVELSTARHSRLLNYGVWGRRGLNEFKAANGFECLAVPRYHVPLSLTGRAALTLGLHRSLKERLPEAWIVRLADARAHCNEWWHERGTGLMHGRQAVAPTRSEP
jgi:hypothetical protein